MKRRGLSLIFAFRESIPRAMYFSIAMASIGAMLAVWWIVSALEWLPATFVPFPGQVLRTATGMLRSSEFQTDIVASSLRIFGAFFVSAAIAIPLGILMSSFKSAEAMIEPIVDFVRYVPVPALLPLFVLCSGIGETSKFLVLFFGTFFQLVLLIMDDCDNVPSIYLDLSCTMGASKSELMRDVLVPYLLPQIYDRLRVTLGWCWTYLVIAELIAVQRGIGHAIKEAQRFNAADQMFVCCIVLGLIGLLTDYLCKFGYRKLFPYACKAQLHRHS